MAPTFLEIDMLLNRYPREISGGQKQRVGIARALVREPVAFAMDEPLSHLDAKLRAYMRAELKRLQKELGITTVFVTHDQLEAMTMADQVAVMDMGVLQQHGPPQELFQQPASVFVAKFIGEPAMNLLPCEIQDEGERTYLVGEAVKLELAKATSQKARERATGNEMLLGVRPQHMILHQAGTAEANGRNVVSGTVYVAEPLGTEQLVVAGAMLCLMLGLFLVSTALYRRPALLRRLLDRLARRVNAPVSRFTTRSIYNPVGLEESIDNLYEAVEVARSKPLETGKALIYGVLTLFSDIACLYFVFYALGFPIRLDVLVVGYVITNYIISLLLMPEGIGITEVSLATVYTSLGVPSATVVVATLLFRFIAFWLPIGAGLVAMWRLRRESLL